MCVCVCVCVCVCMYSSSCTNYHPFLSLDTIFLAIIMGNRYPFFFLSTNVARFVVAGECTPIFSWLGGDTSV